MNYSEDIVNIFHLSVGTTAEYPLDPNKSITAGLGAHLLMFDLYSKDDMGFYDEYIVNSPHQMPIDSVLKRGVTNYSGYLIKARGINIPVAFNLYLTPRFYLSYCVNINFLLGFTHSGFFVANDYDFDNHTSGRFYSYDNEPFTKEIFKSLYTSHTFAFNRIFMRRLQFSLGWNFTFKSGIIKRPDHTKGYLRALNNDFSNFVLGTIGIKWYFYQLKSKSI